jgi:cephalosporin hydroxylase
MLQNCWSSLPLEKAKRRVEAKTRGQLVVYKRGKVRNRLVMTNLTGYIDYQGYAAMQHVAAIDVFRRFIARVRPQRILEIGTAQGGFALALRHLLDEAGLSEAVIKSLDINRLPWFETLEQSNLELITEDVFNPAYSALKKPDLVIPFIREPGVTVVLCDGGYKIGEFNLLARYIKEGDYILAHDYIETETAFQQDFLGKVWDWHEVREVDIAESCREYGLEDYQRDEFGSVVWVCKKRTGRADTAPTGEETAHPAGPKQVHCECVP